MFIQPSLVRNTYHPSSPFLDTCTSVLPVSQMEVGGTSCGACSSIVWQGPLHI